jgi:hypothetical protein
MEILVALSNLGIQRVKSQAEVRRGRTILEIWGESGQFAPYLAVLSLLENVREDVSIRISRGDTTPLIRADVIQGHLSAWVAPYLLTWRDSARAGGGGP